MWFYSSWPSFELLRRHIFIEGREETRPFLDKNRPALYRVVQFNYDWSNKVGFSCLCKNVFIPISNSYLQTHITYLLEKKVGIGLTENWCTAKPAADKFFSTSLSEKKNDNQRNKWVKVCPTEEVKILPSCPSVLNKYLIIINSLLPVAFTKAAYKRAVNLCIKCIPFS